jgi:hypothetical protein
MTFFKKALLGTAAGAMALATAAPAEARGYYRHYHHDNTGAIVGAGILGLAVGALAASSSRDRYYDGYYYNQPYYNGYTYYTPGYTTYYYPYNYGYNDGYWYNGYLYNNGWFYDRRGYRSYDRDGWNRHYGHRDGYRHYRR